MSSPARDHHDLSAWPSHAVPALDLLISSNAHSGQYAVFDADQTTYGHDLTESLLVYLEQQGRLTRDTLAPELKLLPFLDPIVEPESLYSYYLRLCAIDDNIGYPWLAQSFAGMSLNQLKTAIDELMTHAQAMPVRYYVAGQLKTGWVQPPQPIRGMQQLFHALQAQGITVYIVSAGLEEAVRMLLADAQYGYHVPPEQVIGIATLLRHPEQGDLTTSRQQISLGTYGQQALASHQLTTALWAPLTWYEGKSAAIKTYIDPIQPPILVAGDNPASDGPMLFGVEPALGGMRLFIQRSPDTLAALQHAQALRAGQQEALGLANNAQQGWLVVTHAELV